MSRKPLLAATLALLLAGCSNLNDTQQRTLTGGLAGTAGGAVIGGIAGNAGMGALIGAGVGVAGGYLYDQHKKSEERAYQRGVTEGRAS